MMLTEFMMLLNKYVVKNKLREKRIGMKKKSGENLVRENFSHYLCAVKKM